MKFSSALKYALTLCVAVTTASPLAGSAVARDETSALQERSLPHEARADNTLSARSESKLWTRTNKSKLSVVVFRNVKHDSPNKRHCGICVRDAQGKNPTQLDAVGGPGHYSVTPLDASPDRTPKLVAEIPVAEVSQSKQTVVDVLKATPPDNTDHGYNCQSWVGDALTKAVSKGWITKEQEQGAIDTMIDKLMEAPMEDKRRRAAKL